jgi:hypothetical protein
MDLSVDGRTDGEIIYCPRIYINYNILLNKLLFIILMITKY